MNKVVSQCGSTCAASNDSRLRMPCRIGNMEIFSVINFIDKKTKKIRKFNLLLQCESSCELSAIAFS